MAKKKSALKEHIDECKTRYDLLRRDLTTARHRHTQMHKENSKALLEINAKLESMVPKSWLMRGLTAIVMALVGAVAWLIDHLYPFLLSGHSK